MPLQQNHKLDCRLKGISSSLSPPVCINVPADSAAGAAERRNQCEFYYTIKNLSSLLPENNSRLRHQQISFCTEGGKDNLRSFFSPPSLCSLYLKCWLLNMI
jgi:hypothetical protein